MSAVFLGDSHLARAQRLLALIDATVDNRAIGGSTSLELRSQLNDLYEHRRAAFVLSIGTNDAAPWRGVSLDAFIGALTRTLGMLDSKAVTYLAPPGVVEARLAANARWTNAAIDEYRSAALDECRVRGVAAIRTDHVLEPVGPKAFSKDGVHLSGVGYQALLPTLNAAVAAH